MSSRDPHDDSAPDSGPRFSEEAVTPRGGFMARPGMKTPPRHAVVVRVGDAPGSEEIPIARPSVPPPPPSEPDPVSGSEKITLRAIPKASSPPPAVTAEDEERSRRELSMTIPSTLPRDLARLRAPESAPPPSDAPLISSVRASEAPRSSRRGPSRWPIVVAAAAGLLLGLASVATRMHARRAAALQPIATLSPPPAVEALPQSPQAAAATLPGAPTAPSASARPSSAPAAELPPKERPFLPARPASAAAKRSIF